MTRGSLQRSPLLNHRKIPRAESAVQCRSAAFSAHFSGQGKKPLLAYIFWPLSRHRKFAADLVKMLIKERRRSAVWPANHVGHITVGRLLVVHSVKFLMQHEYGHFNVVPSLLNGGNSNNRHCSNALIRIVPASEDRVQVFADSIDQHFSHI